MWWQWSLFRSDAILVFLGQTLLPLLMRLFGLNHRWRCFLDFWFFMFLDGFHGFMCFQGFSILGFTIANYAILLLIYQDRPFAIFLGLLTIVCDYMRWSPHIDQAMRCIVQVYTHLCRWSICWSSVPLLMLLAHTHRHDFCIHHALCVDHIKALGSEPKSDEAKEKRKK